MEKVSSMRFPRIRNATFGLFFTGSLALVLHDATAFDVKGIEHHPGEALVEKIGCLNCHSLDGQGGQVAPDLNHVHERLHENWLFMFLKEPYDIRPLGYIPYSGIRMPNLRLSDEEAKAIANYLSTLNEHEIRRRTHLTQHLNRRENLKEDVQKGQELVQQQPCLNCHSIRGKGGKVGPDLSDVGTRLQPAFIYLWIENPQSFEPNTLMPNLGLNDEQLYPLTRYLMSLRRDLPPVPDRTLSGQLPLSPTQVAQGEKLFRDLCIRCHQLHGQGGETGPDLTYEGDKVNRRWLYQFLNNPYQIRPMGFAQNPIARMPKINLSGEELLMITEFITTLRKGRNLNLPMTQGMMGKMKKPARTRDQMIRMGKMLVNMKGCAGCHRIGKLSLQRVTIAPDLTFVGDRLKEGWIYSWIKDPQKYRRDTLMPNLGLTDMQAQAIAAYLSGLKQVQVR